MTTPLHRGELVETFVDQRVGALQARYLRDRPDAVAALARLRQGVGRRVDADMELLGLALAEPTVDLLAGRHVVSDAPVPEEEAAFAAITLYALHQQSRRDVALHRRGYSLGRSARLLAQAVGQDAVRRRFTALGTSATWEESIHHSRGLIQQLRQQRLPLDYGRFARDLYDLNIGRGDRVRMTWGRDFYRLHDPDDAPSATPDATTADAEPDKEI